MPKEPLYPHVPKSKEAQFPHEPGAKGVKEAGVLPDGQLVLLKSGTEGWIKGQIVEYFDLIPSVGGMIYAGPSYKVSILEGKHKGQTIQVPTNYVKALQSQSLPQTKSRQQKYVVFKNTGATLSWDAWVRELQGYQKRGETPPPVEYPPLKCKYCGALVPKNVLEGRSLDVEVWGSYHIKAHRDAVKELAKEKLPWSAGLIPAVGGEPERIPETEYSGKYKKPTRDDVTVESWQERDRLGIWITDKRTDKTIAEWWDDEARQMFEDGFFKPGVPHLSSDKLAREFVESVLDYAESVGILAGGKHLPQTTELSTSTINLLAKTEGDPIRKFCCRQCGVCVPEELLEEGRFPDRIAWLRQHYSQKHPGMWGRAQSGA